VARLVSVSFRADSNGCCTARFDSSKRRSDHWLLPLYRCLLADALTRGRLSRLGLAEKSALRIWCKVVSAPWGLGRQRQRLLNALTGRLLTPSGWWCRSLALGVLVACCSGTSPVIAWFCRTTPLATKNRSTARPAQSGTAHSSRPTFPSSSRFLVAGLYCSTLAYPLGDVTVRGHDNVRNKQPWLSRVMLSATWVLIQRILMFQSWTSRRCDLAPCRLPTALLITTWPVVDDLLFSCCWLTLFFETWLILLDWLLVIDLSSSQSSALFPFCARPAGTLHSRSKVYGSSLASLS